ncbi:hypothetical protein GGX14DRAFT_598117 [Mycena pura]|uniref:Uncharacterized protein n=1 Tax=Mycena pura TaxID=153505 RepID=A0AAD6YFW4_9AGAR|nr:hypothetical protein GGX14DRAFT_598117 [Mycena pura]
MSARPQNPTLAVDVPAMDVDGGRIPPSGGEIILREASHGVLVPICRSAISLNRPREEGEVACPCLAYVEHMWQQARDGADIAGSMNSVSSAVTANVDGQLQATERLLKQTRVELAEAISDRAAAETKTEVLKDKVDEVEERFKRLRARHTALDTDWVRLKEDRNRWRAEAERLRDKVEGARQRKRPAGYRAGSQQNAAGLGEPNAGSSFTTDGPVAMSEDVTMVNVPTEEPCRYFTFADAPPFVKKFLATPCILAIPDCNWEVNDTMRPVSTDDWDRAMSYCHGYTQAWMPALMLIATYVTARKLMKTNQPLLPYGSHVVTHFRVPPFMIPVFEKMKPDGAARKEARKFWLEVDIPGPNESDVAVAAYLQVHQKEVPGCRLVDAYWTMNK